MPEARARKLIQYDRETDRNIGVNPNASKIAITEFGDGLIHKTKLVLAGLPITVGNTTGVSFGGVKVYTFPQGRIFLKGVTVQGISIGLTNAGNATPIDAADGGDLSMGSTVAGDGTLTGTDVDMLPSTSIDPLSDGITDAALAAAAQFNGVSTPVAAWLNMLIDDADVADAASDILEISGTIFLHWELFGERN